MINSNFRDQILQLHAQFCMGLADPNRILMLYTLSEKPRSVNELVEELSLPQSTVSRHLNSLRTKGLVISQRIGQNVIYSLSDIRIIQALDLLRMTMLDMLKNQASLAFQNNNKAE